MICLIYALSFSTSGDNSSHLPSMTAARAETPLRKEWWGRQDKEPRRRRRNKTRRMRAQGGIQRWQRPADSGNSKSNGNKIRKRKRRGGGGGEAEESEEEKEEEGGGGEEEDGTKYFDLKGRISMEWESVTREKRTVDLPELFVCMFYPSPFYVFSVQQSSWNEVLRQWCNIIYLALAKLNQVDTELQFVFFGLI